jgi:hypothetical protein
MSYELICVKKLVFQICIFEYSYVQNKYYQFLNSTIYMSLFFPHYHT